MARSPASSRASCDKNCRARVRRERLNSLAGTLVEMIVQADANDIDIRQRNNFREYRNDVVGDLTSQVGAQVFSLHSTPASYMNPSRVVLPAETMRRHGGAERISAQSHPEYFRVARLNLLALRFHRGWIALHGLDRG